MKPWLSAAVGAIPGYIVLALTVLWVFNLCLPVSAHEFKWQCEVTFWAVAAAYFGSSFVAAFFADAVIPAMMGVAVAVVARRKLGAHAL